MVLEQVINLDQGRMRNRHARLLVSSVAHDPAIPSPQPAVFHPNRSQRGFRHGGTLLAVPFPCLAAGVCLCACVARADASPTGQMST